MVYTYRSCGRGVLGAGYPITTPHSPNPLAGVGSHQLQPGVEDGGTPTEVVAIELKKKAKTRKYHKKRDPDAS